MTVHLIKLAVGIDGPEHFAERQAACLSALRAAGKPAVLVHRTRQMPRQRMELLEGGSLYWVIRGAVQLRQRLADIDEVTGADGGRCCALVLDPELVPLRPVPHRPFQGWRYLDAADAPPDLDDSQAASASDLPPAMRTDLIELGLL